MTTNVKICLLSFLFSSLIISSCKKKNDAPPTVATLTTTAVTNITPNTATSGGNIADNGGATVTASGICWSKTNTTPTISDDTTKGTVSSGSFTANLKNLASSSTYYVRAYATNTVGTAYGNVVSFTTGNAAPVATAVMVTGQPEVNKTLTATYTYTDAEGDAQSGTTFQWYVANDAIGTGEVAIAGATALTYTIQAAEQGKFIRFGVTPKAGTGTTNGTEVKSIFVGAIGEATTVTFMYNGASVTYGILTSATTGRKWLDRNLGAPNVATSHDNWANYGDVFQWGRLADGHQLVARTGPNDADVTGVKGTTSASAPFEYSSTDVPGHQKFIIVDGFSDPYDWRKPQNNALWQGVNGINNPCPAGWRIPTEAEWVAENLGTITDAYSKLKITMTHTRTADFGGFSSNARGQYWSSTLDGSSLYSMRIRINSTGVIPGVNVRGTGLACRCIKN